MFKRRRSFFERLTGSIALEDEADRDAELDDARSEVPTAGWERSEDVSDLGIDLYQTPNEIIVQAFVSGVKPEDLDVNITREAVTISGRRSEQKQVVEESYFLRELSWGSFERTIALPQEVEPEEAEAVERHGLLTIRLPKLNKDKTQRLKVRIG